ncbi:hypothetical protein [Thalassobellus suaedae]|uniref:Uncharacterized protein n=1 Tax=Thalassobellus suaedae TaxID=3074124 RepID=A0ABY9XYQ5_9FLAO|nr:hypothetical protein RHP49_09265 [Flavobacteriaceae bacterium HL-DH10]
MSIKKYFEIRPSLSWLTYEEHALSLKLAADDSFEKGKEVMQIREQNERIHALGLFRGSMLMYAVSLELILKARALFEEKDNILCGQISSFKEFMNQWKSKNTDGHGYMDIVNHYKIELSEKEIELLNNFQSYTSWAGRFPFPKKEDEISEMEKNGRISGTAKTRHNQEIQEFLYKQMAAMKI